MSVLPLPQNPSGTSGTTSAEHFDFLASAIRDANARPGERFAGEYDCPVCRNKRQVFYELEGKIAVKPCVCVGIRSNLARLRMSGLADAVELFSFENFKADEPWQAEARDKMQAYADEPKGWALLCGRPGTGKTHLCTAVCSELIYRGKDVRYFLWRTDGPKMKAAANTEDYPKAVEPYKSVDVLYIDDFLKGTVTDADKNLAFDLINARYLDERKTTLISTELSPERILQLDEATGSRILERCSVIISTAGRENRRMSGRRRAPELKI